MSSEPSRPMVQCCRLSFTAAVLAIVPLVAVAIQLAFLPLFVKTGVVGEVLSAMLFSTLLGLPFAVLLGLAAILRHAIGPRRRPGLGLAVFASLLAGVELALFVWVAAQY